MRLHEEYLKRKDIRIPLVLFEGDSGVLLRTHDKPYRWLAVNLKWIHDEYWHPGSFHLHRYEFPHNGTSGRRCPVQSDLGKQIFWDEYEEEVIALVSSLSRDYTVVTEEEFDVAICQIVLNSCDALIADKLSVGKLESNFCKDVEAVLDASRDINERAKAAESVLRKLKSAISMTDDVIYEIRNYSKRSGWLASLFKDEDVFSNSGEEPNI